MTDAQIYALIGVIAAGLGSIGAAIRWSINRVASAIDGSAAEARKAIDNNTTAMLENTRGNAVLATKIDRVSDWVEKRGTVPPTTRLKTDPGSKQ